MTKNTSFTCFKNFFKIKSWVCSFHKILPSHCIFFRFSRKYHHCYRHHWGLSTCRDNLPIHRGWETLVLRLGGHKAETLVTRAHVREGCAFSLWGLQASCIRHDWYQGTDTGNNFQHYKHITQFTFYRLTFNILLKKTWHPTCVLYLPWKVSQDGDG